MLKGNIPAEIPLYYQWHLLDNVLVQPEPETEYYHRIYVNKKEPKTQVTL